MLDLPVMSMETISSALASSKEVITAAKALAVEAGSVFDISVWVGTAADPSSWEVFRTLVLS